MQGMNFSSNQNNCEARAHIIADRIAKKGIFVGKSWYFGQDLFHQTDRKNFNSGWSFHVAPFVLVKANNGKVSRYVIDPSVADQILPVSEFEKLIRPKGNGQPFRVPAENLPQNLTEWPQTIVTFTDKEPYVLLKTSKRELT